MLLKHAWRDMDFRPAPPAGSAIWIINGDPDIAHIAGWVIQERYAYIDTPAIYSATTTSTRSPTVHVASAQPFTSTVNMIKIIGADVEILPADTI
jgi:hypothetical protein